ncbi:MAG: DNA-directed RNA polymerase subunit alpha C-terminal domain-containing protein [Pirellulales bacterium]
MAQAAAIDINDVVVNNGSFGPKEIEAMIGSISADALQLSALRDAVAELEGLGELTPASAVRLGIGYYLLGRYDRAIETLSRSDGGALAHYYLGQCYTAKEDWEKARSSFLSAAKAGYDAGLCQVAIAQTQRLAREPAAALQTLDNLFGPVEQTAEYLYQRGATIAAIGGNPSEVVALYERAVKADELHSGALFGLALENDRRGNDELALEYYQRSAARFPAHVGALINLGIMYEDRDQYDKAQRCYKRVLDAYPDHKRARLYFVDASASGDMYYDEEAQKRRDRLSQVLGIPVSDFELSVRSRNCLQKMGIATLGDLTRCTEQDLLASKNFGETSLVEIRDMLSSKGLQLGQFAHERVEPEPVLDFDSMSPDEQALLERPIAELNLSVRARKCMVRLGLSTIGELIRKTGDDLLECKNFGVTSLTEVREKLTQYGLKLRGD